MIALVAGCSLLGVGALLCYCSHPNQRLRARPLGRASDRLGQLLMTAGALAWVMQVGWRTGPLVAAMLLMLLFGALPLLSLIGRADR